MSVPAAPPGGGDHRGGQRRADRRGQHIQATHQQALAPDLRMPERRVLLGVPVDRFCCASMSMKASTSFARQQRGAAGQLRQDLPVHLAQLQVVPPGERPQERPQRRRRADARIPEGRSGVIQVRVSIRIHDVQDSSQTRPLSRS